MSKIIRKMSQLFSGSLGMFGGVKPDEPLAGKLRAAQIATIVRNTPWIMGANVVNAVIFLTAYLHSQYHVVAVVWTFWMLSISLYFYLRHRNVRTLPPPTSVSVRAIHKVTLNAFIIGCLWAVVPIAFLEGGSGTSQMVIVALVTGMACGGALSLSSVPIAAISFMIPVFASGSLAFARFDSFLFFLISSLMTVYLFMLLRSIVTYANQFAQRFVSEMSHEEAAYTDLLTGLPNRLAFEKQMEEVLYGARRYGDQFAIMLLDLDRFKEINDTFGHSAGDDFLVETAERLKLCLRDGDILARISGDEFVVIASKVAESGHALALADRLMRALDRPVQLRGVDVQGSVTIGIALVPSDGIVCTDLMKKADEALYKAKNACRGTCQFYNQHDENRALLQKELANDLRHAISNDQLNLVFQPIMNAKDGSISAFEALLRWSHPERGVIPPDEFIPLAEKSGLIHELGEWAISRAVREASLWPDHIRVAINISPVQFRTLELISIVARVIKKYRIDPARIELEITESLVLSNIERAETILQRLSEMGVKIALDDFGTGFSSLSYLVRLPLDRLKIDRSFIRELPASRTCAKLVRGIVGLAEQFELELVAEGVETHEQLSFLRDFKIGEIQGYVISHPLDRETLPDFLKITNACTVRAA